MKLSVALSVLGLVSTSCTNDDDHNLINTGDQKPLATTSVTSLTLKEGETKVIPFTISKPLTKVSYFHISAVSGSAVAGKIDPEDETEIGDFIAGEEDNNADFGDPNDGYLVRVPGNATSFDIPVTALFDLDQEEGDKNVRLKITATGTRTIITPGDVFVDVSIKDFNYCLWTLEMNDAYADGWQGAYITVDSDGIAVDYSLEDGATETIQVPVGSPFVISYVSGTTGTTSPNQPGSPGWEEEVTYTLTSPGGTVYSDGPVPAVGVIVDGTDNCN
ncbi:hypothetical protein ACFSQP_08315 [Bizionia sediminis]|uniref:DUF1735 domain-containing protein n=1 Tax=Bizionia sediminis TaxID=1737064 RepID=A0ABW5KW45_9FLAO